MEPVEAISTKEKHPRRYWFLSVLYAFVAWFSLAAYLSGDVQWANRFFVIVGIGGYIVLGASFLSMKNRRLRRFAFVVGLCFSFAQICGARLEASTTLARADRLAVDLLLLTASTLCSAPAIGRLFALLVELFQKQQRPVASIGTKRFTQRQVLLGSAAIIFLCWLPVLLAYYPGLFTYDVSYQYQQFVNWNINTHHPILHTLMVGSFCKLGEILFQFPVKGLLLYTLLQMALLSLSMGSAIASLYRHGLKTKFCVALLLVFGLLPFHSLLAISTTKDTLFAGFTLYATVLLLDVTYDPQCTVNRWWQVRFLLTLALCGLFRNNGFIFVGGVVIVGLVVWLKKRKYGKNLMALGLLGLVLTFGVNAGLKLAVNAQDGSMNEVMSVPVQTLGRVYQYSDDRAKDRILAFIPDAERYSNTISDPLKATLKITPETIPAFVQLWLEVGIRHPIIYLDAFCMLNKEYFSLDSTIKASGGQYLETKFHTDAEHMMYPHSLWPQLGDLMTRLFSRNEYLQIPILSQLLAHSFWCWLAALCALAGWYARSSQMFTISLPTIVLLCSIFLGPCVMFRYIYPIVLCATFLLGSSLLPRQYSSGTDSLSEALSRKAE